MRKVRHQRIYSVWSCLYRLRQAKPICEGDWMLSRPHQREQRTILDGAGLEVDWWYSVWSTDWCHFMKCYFQVQDE